jgi:anti-sigma factor RsiW
MCFDEARMIKLIAGELPDAERDMVLAHLAECTACRELHGRIQATWDQLGQWDVSVPSGDLTGAILAVASRPPAVSWRGRVAVVAAVIVAAGMGWMLGRLPAGVSQPVSATSVTAEDMAQHVGLDVLAGDLGAFHALFPDDLTPENGAGQGGQL